MLRAKLQELPAPCPKTFKETELFYQEQEGWQHYLSFTENPRSIVLLFTVLLRTGIGIRVEGTWSYPGIKYDIFSRMYAGFSFRTLSTSDSSVNYKLKPISCKSKYSFI